MAKAKSKSNFVLIVLVLIIGVGFITYTNTDKRIEPNVLGGQRVIYTTVNQGPCIEVCANLPADGLGPLFDFCMNSGIPYHNAACFSVDGYGGYKENPCGAMQSVCYDLNDPDCSCPDDGPEYCYMEPVYGFDDPGMPPIPTDIPCGEIQCVCGTSAI